MNASKKQSFIGFPAPLLEKEPVRLPLLYEDESVYILEKPADMLVLSHDWYKRRPNLTDALGWQIAQGKPELHRLGILEAHPVLALDPDLTGAALFARDEESAAYYRNQLGSEQMTLQFTILARSLTHEDTVTCSLPLAHHFNRRQMVVSHQTGKKCLTAFEREKQYGPYTLWTAKTNFLRHHQIRLHAVESGLTPVGETLYGREPHIFLSRIKRDYRIRGEENPLYDSICIHLSRLSFNTAAGETVELEIPLPKRFRVLLDRLDRHCIQGE